MAGGGRRRVQSGPAVALFLNLSVSVDVFYVPSHKPGRSYNLVLEGLRAHPGVTLVDDAAGADLVFYHHQAWDHRLSFDRERLVFVDFADDPLMTYPIRALAYFKRSWPYPGVDPRLDPPGDPCVFEMLGPARPASHHPTGYAVMREFIIEEQYVRDIDLGCFLRANMVKRGVVLQLLSQALGGSGFRVQLGPVSDAGRSTFDSGYLTALRRSKVVVTVGPDLWEGDSRTWEALASGTLVIQEELKTPVPYPLVRGEHIAYFNVHDLHRDPVAQQEFISTVGYYLTHLDEAARIGSAGREHVLSHHRPVHRVHEMLRIVGAADEPLPAGG
jgi:Glycosyl transferases group 1